MKEEVRPEQSSLRLLKEKPSVPAVRDVWCREETQAMTPGFEHFSIAERARRAVGEIVDHHHCADKAANSLRVWRDFQPLVQRAALVGLEMAEADPAHLRRIYDS